jgi:hypothetical protein
MLIRVMHVCPTNKERNSLSASVFWMHVNNTHPSVQSDELPSGYTIVIEEDFHTTAKKTSFRLNVTNTVHIVFQPLVVMIISNMGDTSMLIQSCVYTQVSVSSVSCQMKNGRKTPSGNGSL